MAGALMVVSRAPSLGSRGPFAVIAARVGEKHSRPRPATSVNRFSTATLSFAPVSPVWPLQYFTVINERTRVRQLMRCDEIAWGRRS